MTSGAQRQARKSEEIFKEIWFTLPNLLICLWYPLPPEALGIIEMLKQDLDRLSAQIKVEQKESEKPEKKKSEIILK